MEYSARPDLRINEILGDHKHLGPNDSFSYSWNHGYEKLTIQREGGGTFEFQGAYHPDVVCEGNPCRYCGMAFLAD